MRKMLAVLGIVVVLVIAVPVIMGFAAKSRYQELVTHLNTTIDPRLQIKISDYKRGWFSSTALLNVDVALPNESGNAEYGQPATATAAHLPATQLLITEKIYHGPVIFKNGIHFAIAYILHNVKLSPQHQQILDNWFQGQGSKPTIEGETLINYSGSNTSGLRVPAFSYRAKIPLVNVDWKGLDFSWSVNKSMKKLKSEFDFSGGNIDATLFTANIGRLLVNTDIVQELPAVWVGATTIQLPTIRFSSPQPQYNVVFDGAKLNTESEISSNNMLDGKLTLDMGKITVGNTSYGPGELEVSLKNLDAVAVSRVNQNIRENMKNETSLDQERAQLFSLLPELPKVLAKGANISLEKLKLVTPQGAITARGEMKLTETYDASKQGSFMALLQEMNGYLEINAPKEIVEKVVASELATKLQYQKNVALKSQQVDPNATNPEPLQSPALSGAAQNPPPPALTSLIQMTPQQLQQQALVNAQQLVANLVKGGVLKESGIDYQIRLDLKSGQIAINGQALSTIQQQITNTLIQQMPAQTPGQVSQPLPESGSTTGTGVVDQPVIPTIPGVGMPATPTNPSSTLPVPSTPPNPLPNPAPKPVMEAPAGTATP